MLVLLRKVEDTVGGGAVGLAGDINWTLKK